MKSSDLAWAAGLFDGEGCIVIRKPAGQNRKAYVVQLTLANVHRPALERFIQISGVGYLRARTFLRGEKWRKVWVWQTAAAKAEQVLKKLRPFLTIKAEEADLALEFRRLPRTFRGRGGKLTEAELALRESYHFQLQQLKHYEYLDSVSGPTILLAFNSRSGTETAA